MPYTKSLRIPEARCLTARLGDKVASGDGKINRPNWAINFFAVPPC